MLLNDYPRQKITNVQRNADKDSNGVPKWYKDNACFFGKAHNSYSDISTEMTDLLNLLESEFDDDAYNYVTNPHNTTKEEYKRYPAKMRNYDILSPIVDRHLGEQRTRPDTVQIRALNYRSTYDYIAALQANLQENLKAQFFSELERTGILNSSSSSLSNGKNTEAIDYKVLRENFEKEYAKSKAEKGQRSYNFLKQSQNLVEKTVALFNYWIAVGRVVTYKDITNDDVYYNVLDPREYIPLFMSPGSKMFEDAGAGIYRSYWSVSSIIDKFGSEISESQLDKLESLMSRVNESYTNVRFHNEYIYTEKGGANKSGSGLICVEHAVWKTLEPVYVLMYKDEYGNPQKIEVDESYKLEPQKGDISLKKKWDLVWHETWRIPEGHSYKTADSQNKDLGEVYLRWGRGKVQRNEVNNSSSCKLPYNGTYRGLSLNKIHSTLKTGIAYQELYNIQFFRFEMTMAKNKDKLLLFPLGLIPAKKGWDTDRWMHAISAFSIAFFDEKQQGAQAAINAIKDIDMSLSQYMADTWRFMQEIKGAWEEAAGFNKQRMGETAQSAGKGTTQEAVFRSSMATKDLVGEFDFFQAQDVAGLIDTTKLAWKKGKQAPFIGLKGKVEELDIDEDYLNTEYGVYVTNSAVDYENLMLLKQLAQPMMQNGGSMLLSADVVLENDAMAIRDLIEKGEKIQKAFESAQADADREVQKYAADAESKRNEADNATRIEVAKIGAAARKEVAMLTADSFNAQLGDTDNDGIAESDEIMQRAEEREMNRRSMNETQRANMAKEDVERQKVQATREKSMIDLKIAKENKNKYDK